MTRRGMAGAVALALAIALAFSATLVHADELNTGQQALLRNAQMWLSRNRLDLARQNVDKLLAVAPDSPQGLAVSGNIALLEGHTGEAQRILAQLRARQPGQSATADLATLVRVYGPDREKLAQIRLMAQAGRKSEAAELARQLFPEGPPTIGGLAREYYLIVGSDKRSAAQADAALQRLYQSTGDTDYRLTQLELQLNQDGSALDLARKFEALAGDTRVNPLRLQALWRRALGRLDNSAAAKLQRQAYLRRYPDDDQGVAEQLSVTSQPVQQAPRSNASHSETPARRLSAAPTAQRRRQAERPGQQNLANSRPSPDEPAPVQFIPPEQVQPSASERASILAQQAEQAQIQQNPDAALNLLQQAVALAPRDPWLRHSLARQYLKLSQQTEALQVMDEGMAVFQSASDAEPGMADMRFARALIRSATDDYAGALADLESVSPELRSDSMRALMKSASVHAAVVQAAEPGADADALLAQAEQIAGDDVELLFAIANSWFQRGQGGRGVAVFDRLLERAPTPAARLEHAALLNRADQDERLAALLPALLAEPGWTPEQAARLFALQTDHLERLTAAAMAGGDRAQALSLAQTALYRAADQPPSQQVYANGRLLYAAQDYAGAAQQFEHALDSDADQSAMADQTDIRLALGDAQARQGHRLQASEQARWLEQHLDQDDVTRRLALLRLWQRIPAMGQARALAQQLRQRFPQDTDVLLHAARLERAEDNYPLALDYFQQARALELQPNAGSQPRIDKIDQDISAIEGRRQAWVETGMERLHKSSTPGISSLSGWEIPAVAWIPAGYDGNYFLHVDQVRLDAGPLPASARQAAEYGQVAAWPQQAYPVPADRPRSNGVNLGFGYRGSGTEWDLGAIGVGMTQTNLVGGISRSEWSEDFSYRVELSRRPLTDSLLSYAGAHDPITGQEWGGVIATGVSGRVSRPWGPYSVSLSGGFALLQGSNVKSNTRLLLRAAIDRDVLRKPHELVNLGLTLSWWSYQHDLSEFTWGHGGYYSPRNYVSLALPVEWSGRRGAFSWLLRGAISVSHSSSNASDYYPTSPGLQSQALALGQIPVYPGGGSFGFGRALRAAFEYQITPNLSLGAQLSLDRSAYYSPTRFLVYLRYLLDPVRAPLLDRPRPVEPYSSF